MAHLRQRIAADHFVPILEGGEFFAEVEAAMAALTFIGHNLAGDFLATRQLPYSPLELRTPSQIHSRTDLSDVKWKNECGSISGVPVTKGGKLVGILTNRDLRFESASTYPSPK